MCLLCRPKGTMNDQEVTNFNMATKENVELEHDQTDWKEDKTTT